MARTAGKRQGKSAPVTTKEKTAAGSNKKASSTITPDSNSKPVLGSDLPEPFSPAPSSLQPFLSTLPHDHVFLTHLDYTPTDLKRRVFLVPCLLNLVIVLGLCVRIYYAVPTYLQQLSAIFGYDSPYKVNVSQESTASLVGTVFDRTFLLFFDYTLFAVLGSWPRQFLFGSAASRFAGPVEWRWTLGFRDVEVIVRRGRKWDAPFFVQPPTGEGQEQQQQQAPSPPPPPLPPKKRQSPPRTSLRKAASGKGKGAENERTTPWDGEEVSTLIFKTSAAMTPRKLGKTGYLLLDKDYDIDFRAILDAHRLAVPESSAERARLNVNDIDGCVFVYHGSQWLIWRPNSDSNTPETGSVPTGTTGAVGTAREESPTPGPEDVKVERFRQALVDLKCRTVFYRWIEIVQFETSRPGLERSEQGRSGVIVDEKQRQEALHELKKLLKAKGVALDTLLDKIGGVQELPGF